MNSILGKWIKKRNKSDFVVLILLGVMVMIVAMPTGAKQSQKETQTQEQKEQQLQTEDSYKEQLQQQLKELLEHMDGVGKTRVMLTFSDEGTDRLEHSRPAHVDIYYHFEDIPAGRYELIIAVTPCLYECETPILYYHPAARRTGVRCVLLPFPHRAEHQRQRLHDPPSHRAGSQKDAGCLL